MKKIRFFRFIACLPVIFFLTACVAARCECENNRKYKQRKAKISLINYQKNTTFAMQKEGNREL
jgi:outer membrane biogenesis lipoprotein LolB